jgi:uncharacterized protein with HEPN domain
MAKRDFRDFLEDLVNACRSIIGFVEGMSFEAYLADEKTRFAVTRGYEIMGEATRRLPSELKDANADSPGSKLWRASIRSTTE